MNTLLLQIDPLEVVIVIAASVVLTLLFDLPMQEVKSVIMESTDISMLEDSKEEKTNINEDESFAELAEVAKGTVEQANVFEDDEIASTGWDWQKDIARGAVVAEGHDTEDETVNVPILKKVNGRRMSFIDHETHDSDEMSSKDRATVFRRLSKDAEENVVRGKRGINSQRYATDDSEDETIEFLRSQREHETAQRRRSLSRTKDSKKLTSRESESEEERQRKRKSDDDLRQFGRSESKEKASTKQVDDYRSWEFVGKEGLSAKEQYEAIPRQTKAPLAKSADVAKKILSSESEEEPSIRGTQLERVPSSETKTSDEEDWEHELRIRRKQFMEQLVAQKRESLSEERSEPEAEPLKRRSSAEGRIALLSDDVPGEDNMNSWTVSVGARIDLLGSSQEPSEPEDDGIYMRRREYREQGPPSREASLSEEESSQDTSRRQSYTSGSQKTSLEEEDDANNHNFVLTKESKRESLQDLSKLSQEELTSAGWNVVKKDDDPSTKSTSTGLFKRESIVKSQASEEDPEYLLPERPKLVQQEREHPFKKAWQMQKSRSEEEGSSAYAIKDPKEPSEAKQTKETSIKREHSGEQSEDAESLADEEAVLLRGKSTDTEENRTSSKSGTEERDSASTEYSKDSRDADYRQSSKSETDDDSGRFNWPSEEAEEEEEEEEEIYRTDWKRKSEEADWDWEREET